MSDTQCPYCGALQEINHDDGYGYEEDETYQQECGSCSKTFIYTTSVSYFYDANKADCLNGGQHNYQLSHTYPKRYSRMVCQTCDDQRSPTPEEREKYHLNDDVRINRVEGE